ncbi:MAG: hypothetical protein WD021_03175 [Rhodothermales bacterium]
MSLKAFHIVFIAVSTLLAVGFGVWELARYAESGNVWMLVAGLVSFGVGVGLVVYGVRFLRKLKHIGYL